MLDQAKKLIEEMDLTNHPMVSPICCHPAYQKLTRPRTVDHLLDLRTRQTRRGRLLSLLQRQDKLLLGAYRHLQVLVSGWKAGVVGPQDSEREQGRARALSVGSRLQEVYFGE